MSFHISNTHYFCTAINHYARYAAGLPDGWLKHITDKEKYGLPALEDTICALRRATTNECELFGNGCQNLSQVEEIWDKEHRPFILSPNRLFFFDKTIFKSQCRKAQELAETRFGIGFGSLVELNGDGSPEFLETLELYADVFSTMEIRLFSQEKLGLFTRTFRDMAAHNASKELLNIYSYACLDFLDNDLPIEDLSDAFLHYAIYHKVPDKYRLRVKYDTLQNETWELIRAIRDDYFAMREEEQQNEWEATKRKLLKYSTYSNIGKLIGFGILEILRMI